LVLVVALALLLLRIHSDLASVYRHLSVSRLPWLAAAVGAEVASFMCYAAVQHRLLLAGGARMKPHTMLELAVAATGLTNLVPGGTAPASGWLVGQYRRHGIPMQLALWAVLAGGFAATVAVLFLLLLGAFVASLIPVWVALGCAVLLVAGAYGCVLGVHHIDTLDHWVHEHQRSRVGRLVGRLVGRISGVVQFRTTVAGGIRIFALSLGNWALDVVCLGAAFAVLNVNVPWRAVLFAYATAQVAGSLAPVPGGIGFVEGGMIGAFALAGTSAGAAFIPIIVYRLITSWGVAGVGSLALLLVHHREASPAELHGEAASLAKHEEDDKESDKAGPLTP
jgi:uncharacterized protein (TIRG00374 family)